MRLESKMGQHVSTQLIKDLEKAFPAWRLEDVTLNNETIKVLQGHRQVITYLKNMKKDYDDNLLKPVGKKKVKKK